MEEIKTISGKQIPVPQWGRIPRDGDWSHYDKELGTKFLGDRAELRCVSVCLCLFVFVGV